jgi:aquaporin Z
MDTSYIVEFWGTFFLVFVILYTNNFLAIGLALALGVYFGGNISGGAFNPAVAVVLYAKGKIKILKMVLYILVEIMGAMSALYLLELLKRSYSNKFIYIFF